MPTLHLGNQSNVTVYLCHQIYQMQSLSLQDNHSAREADVTPQLLSWLLIYFQSEPRHQDAFLRVDIMGPRKHFFRLVYTEYICVNINAI